VFLTYTIEVVRLTTRAPLASLPVQVTGWMVWGYYAFLGGLTWFLAQTSEHRRELWAKLVARLEWKVLAGAAAILLVLALVAWRALPDGRLHVTFLDVGEGDAIFIQTPAGRQVLVDGGPSGTALLSQLGRRMPFWDRTLDVVVLTHPEADHLTGLLPALERYRVDAIIFRAAEVESAEYERWLQLVEAEGAAVYPGEAGLRLALDEGLEMVVLWPGAELVGGPDVGTNDNSVVTRLTYGQVSVLLMGDAEAEVERQLATVGAIRESPLRSTVLKVAHHGSCNSTMTEFLAAVAPQVAVISVGAENRFDHPCAEVLERLGDVPVYRTDQDGTVEVVSDGTQVWMETER
jgi:competence protein ComEC